MRKKNEGKHIVKKDHWGNITTRYTEYKHKNTGTTCTSVHISRLQCFNPSTKFWKTVSLRPSFGLSVKIWSQFSRLVCFNWVRNEVFTSLILGKNLWTWQTRRTDAWNNIFWEVTTSKYMVYKKIIKGQVHNLNIFCFCAMFITHAYENNILRTHEK